MVLGPPSSAIYIQNVNPNVSANQPRTPTLISLHPVALFSILDHYLRRTDSQHRVIGTLLGTRNPDTGEVQIKSSFAVLHSETSEQVAVDMEYHRNMFELSGRGGGREGIVGWYSTGSNLNTYSALIQNFYSQETAPHPAIHIALNTGVEEGEQPGVKAYISSPVGVHPKPENCVFVPVPCEFRFRESERSGLDLLLSPSTPPTQLSSLSSTLTSLSTSLDSVLSYVQSVLKGEKKGDAAVGRYLMDVFGAVDGGSGKEGDGFRDGLQDTLMISYLANLVRSQAEVSARLALTTAA
ncbi:hypothetical protein JAAARDRAFT_145128 [Jaapia argillacea MUCL 33604]|uniref:Eukaryotic translation initiation factor 3 subunit F n=1 Tax=Jaapia argillacea MUCL 33604 TaxID=933084 RepID=A0A067QBX0_9AGAM|nr:hypothetical protein JAAARDRAFT_145128 [Jaapia argillacea MUCL 33604]